MQNISHPEWRIEGFDMKVKVGWVDVPGLCQVYIVAGRDHEEGEPLKIGVASNPRRRLKALQQGSPGELRLFHTWTFADQLSAANFEMELHGQFAEHHIRGEWFSAPWRFVRLAGDLLLAGERKRLTRICAFVEDADLCEFLNNPAKAAANMAEAIKLGYPDPDDEELWLLEEGEINEPQPPAPPPYVKPKGNSAKAILAAYKEARGL